VPAYQRCDFIHYSHRFQRIEPPVVEHHVGAVVAGVGTPGARGVWQLTPAGCACVFFEIDQVVGGIGGWEMGVVGEWDLETIFPFCLNQPPGPGCRPARFSSRCKISTSVRSPWCITTISTKSSRRVSAGSRLGCQPP